MCKFYKAKLEALLSPGEVLEFSSLITSATIHISTSKQISNSSRSSDSSDSDSLFNLRPSSPDSVQPFSPEIFTARVAGGGGVRVRGGGRAWPQAARVCQRGHVWLGGMHGGGRARPGGVCGRRGCMHATHAPLGLILRDTVGQWAGGTHPTGIHSCKILKCLVLGYRKVLCYENLLDDLQRQVSIVQVLENAGESSVRTG